MKRVMSKVNVLLDQHEYLRSNDHDLLLAFWKSEGLYLTPEQEQVFGQCTPAESITRARRALRDKYPGSKEVEEVRYQKFVESRDEYGTPIMIRMEE